jgi:hypothetical protein
MSSVCVCMTGYRVQLKQALTKEINKWIAVICVLFYLNGILWEDVHINMQNISTLAIKCGESGNGHVLRKEKDSRFFLSLRWVKRKRKNERLAWIKIKTINGFFIQQHQRSLVGVSSKVYKNRQNGLFVVETQKI